jgi:mxaD protein
MFKLSSTLSRTVTLLFGLIVSMVFAPSAHADRALLHHKDQITLKATPQQAWDAIKKFDSIHTWHPAVESTVLLLGTNGKPLAVREFQLKGGGWVISELLAYSESKRWYRYRIVKTTLPLKGYIAELQVKPAPGGALVVWSAEFMRPEETPKAGEDDAATSQLVKNVVRAGLENLQNVAGK